MGVKDVGLQSHLQRSPRGHIESAMQLAPAESTLQDPELRDLACEWSRYPTEISRHQFLRISVTGGDGTVNTVILTRHQADRVAEVIRRKP
jgi:hypothetical protein